MKIEKKILGIQKNILLKNYTTFQVGGQAKYFLKVETKDELIKVIQAVKKINLPFFILGGGSNLLVSDKGYGGLIIKFQVSSFKFQDNEAYVGAGALLGNLVKTSADKGLSGLEWAAGIPGTLGGAIRGNAGAFEKSITDVIQEVEVLDVKDLKIKKLKNKDCNFGYRESVFKYNSNLIILSAILRLKKRRQQDIQKKIQEYLDYRKTNHPLNFPSAGSVFKNPKIKIVDLKLLKEFPEIKNFNKKKIIPAGFLIEKSGLKGKKIGNVQISEKHCNFIINLGKGKAEDVKKLINLAKAKVKDKFKINLEEEIYYLGF